MKMKQLGRNSTAVQYYLLFFEHSKIMLLGTFY